MNTSTRICVAQLKISPDREVNLMKGLSLVKRAIQLRSDLVVLPEVHNTGFFEHNYEFVEPVEKELKMLLKLSENREMIIIAGIAEKEGDDLYNSAVIIQKGKIVGLHRKTHLFPLTSERQFFKEGNKLEVFETSIGRIGILICYELRFPEIARKLMKKGAEMIVVPAAFPKERIEHWSILLRARAIENQLFVVGANCVEGDLNYGGRSAIVDPFGKIIAEASDVQEVIMGDIDLLDVQRVRREYPFLNLREEII